MTDKPTAYLETTIPSFLAARPSNALILAGQQQLTLRWSRDLGYLAPTICTPTELFGD